MLEKGKPYLGLCLGMQLLAERGYEHGEHRGLGWIGGEVRRIEPNDPKLRIPHIGWNSVAPTRKDSILFKGMKGDPSFYFVHSYSFRPSDSAVASGVTDHGCDVVATVEQGHVFGTQFHPEKSQKAGLALLRNFLEFKC